MARNKSSERSAGWTLDDADGELTVHTGVAGRAGKMGHRLTIAMTRWRANVKWLDDQPISAELLVEVDSLEVVSGVGGIKGLSGPEKVVARSNALKSLSAKRFPEIAFTADTIEQTANGYRLHGTLRIHGRQSGHVVELHTEDLGGTWRLSAQSSVRQTDFGIKPFSMLMGSLRVADEVTVSFTATRTA